jgi:hypothetical protein
MAPKIKTKKEAAINALLHGWGYVEGKWVYVPLWDPPHEFGSLRQLIAGAALAEAAKLVAVKEHATALKVLAGKLVAKATAGFTTAWEDGDPICPPWPPRFPWPRPWPSIPFPWPPGPGPDPGPDPGPIYDFVTQLNPAARNAVVGSMISTIGQMIDDKAVVELGNQISNAH